MPKLFLCHSSADKKFVRHLTVDLNRQNISVWVDEREILVGDPIREKIESGLNESDYLGIVLSPAAIKSGWVNKELDAKLIEEIESKKVVVLPLLLADCDVPRLLIAKLYADFRTNYDDGLQTLLARFRRNDRETEVKRAVLTKLAGDDAARVDAHQLLALALAAKQIECVEELLAVHQVSHPGCPHVPLVRAGIDVFIFQNSSTPKTWISAIRGAIVLWKHNPVPPHRVLLEDLSGRVPNDGKCTETCLAILNEALQEIKNGNLAWGPTVAAALVRASHKLFLRPEEIELIISSAHAMMRDLDVETLRPLLSHLLHASTHLLIRMQDLLIRKRLLRQVFETARLKVDRSHDYSDAFLHLAWAAALIGLKSDGIKWLQRYQLTVSNEEFSEKVAKHHPLGELIGEENFNEGLSSLNSPRKRKTITGRPRIHSSTTRK